MWNSDAWFFTPYVLAVKRLPTVCDRTILEWFTWVKLELHLNVLLSTVKKETNSNFRQERFYYTSRTKFYQISYTKDTHSLNPVQIWERQMYGQLDYYSIISWIFGWMKMRGSVYYHMNIEQSLGNFHKIVFIRFWRVECSC